MSTRFDDWEGDFLAHHGIKGQKWGVRRFQNEDGSLTSSGRKHYGLAEGGSRKMSRQFSRQVKKLNRLATKADVKKQEALSEKYSKRAKIGAKVTAGLAAGTAGSYLSDLGAHKKDMASQKLLNHLHNEKWSNALAEIQRGQRLPGGIDEASFKHLSNIMSRERADANRAFDAYQTSKGRSKFGSAGSASLRTKALAGATAVAGGYTAYAAIRSKIAKSRTTDKGHAKAIAKGRAQLEKMFDQFKGTPYSKLLKDQVKKKQIKFS